MEEIKLLVGGHTITVALNGNGGGSVSSDLHEPEPYPCPEDDDDCEANDAWADTESQVDVVEGLILAHACAGVDVEAPAYIEGLETVLNVIFA